MSGERDQPVGHNFFVNSTAFLNAGRPWAVDFDDYLRRKFGNDANLREIAIDENMAGKDGLLEALTRNPDPELTRVLAVYLAGRSLEGEQYLEDNYGEMLVSAKEDVRKTTDEIARTTGLRPDMRQRASAQLERTQFGAFDHLAAMVTSENRDGTLGDYLAGSLRVEVLFEGSVRGARNRTPEEAKHIVTHEVVHASSAQETGRNRCGLRVRQQGLEANEGMDEYIAQVALGKPGFTFNADVPLRSEKVCLIGRPYSSCTHCTNNLKLEKTRISRHYLTHSTETCEMGRI